MRAARQNLPLHEQYDLVVSLDGGDLLCDRDECQPGVITLDIGENLLLGIRIDAGSEVVEEKNLGIERERTSEHEALLLPARERRAPLGDDRIETLWQRIEE